MPDTKIAHGGKCPNGYIFDHKKGSSTYGQCIPVTGKLAKKPKITKKLGSYVKT